MMEKCWEKPCICYFNRRSVKNGRRFLYKITASIFMRGLQEKGRILKKIFCFSNFAGQEEEGISSFFKISASLNQFLLSRIWELRRAYSTRFVIITESGYYFCARSIKSRRRLRELCPV